MANINDWNPEVGMEVFVVPFDRRYPPTKEKIDKVSRKYFYVGRSRFSIISKSEDNGDFSSCSKCYRSESDYKRYKELLWMMNEISRKIHNLTDEQVVKVYEMINK